jgi:hypothetical protein
VVNCLGLYAGNAWNGGVCGGAICGMKKGHVCTQVGELVDRCCSNLVSISSYIFIA